MDAQFRPASAGGRRRAPKGAEGPARTSAAASDAAAATLTGPPGPEGIPLEQGTVLAPSTASAGGQTVAGIRCDSSEQVAYHIHSHLTVCVNGVLRPASVWGRPLTAAQVGPARGAVTVFVNGVRYSGGPSGNPADRPQGHSARRGEGGYPGEGGLVALAAVTVECRVLRLSV
jgi:hypothetical protein